MGPLCWLSERLERVRFSFVQTIQNTEKEFSQSLDADERNQSEQRLAQSLVLLKHVPL
jgi:hypothetical protein